MPNFNNGADLAPTPAENTPEPAAVHEGQVSPAGGRRPTVDSIPDADLVKRAVVGAHQHGPMKARWQHVQDAFGLGSTFAAQLCRRFGLDPDQRVGIARRRGDS